MPLDPGFLKELDRFRLAVKKKVHTKYKGSRQSGRIGEGLVFADYAPYTKGDDIRYIDWNVFARTNKLVVKRMEEEQNSVLHIILDASSSMKFGSPNSKFEYAAMIGVGFAYMALNENEKFEFTTFSDRLNYVPVRNANILSIIDTINSVDVKGTSKLSDSLYEYKKRIHSKSLVIIISDFMYDIEDLQEVLLRYKRSDAYLIQVLDPLEKSLSLKGDVVLKDMESPLSLRTFISNRLRKNYQGRMREHVLRIADLCDRFDARFTSVTTDIPIFEVFYKILFEGRKAV